MGARSAAVAVAWCSANCARTIDFASRWISAMLRAPLVGNWLRDIAVLQLMDVLNSS